MSYEHCARHDASATNGCEHCTAERIGDWVLMPSLPAHWQLRRNGVLVGEFADFAVAKTTREIWIRYLTESGERFGRSPDQG